MFAHALDLCLTNGWLEYKKQAEILEILKKNVFDLLGFRAYVAKGLIRSDQVFVRKVGLPSASPSTSRSSKGFLKVGYANP
ncbi:hypothetical protein MTP99_003798 [Tenebrio molitor]|jgi:hypothetical protein|nr:hypothetical protein MTP99_003798 [Tenebrio molitor]